MKEKKIYHNIGVLAHVDSGKTTLTEQLLYLTGAVREAGSVDKGNAVTDNLDIERRRGISVRTSTASAEWNGVNINLIDTPGHTDFAGEVERSLTALDYAIVIVSAVEGVRAHTENILRALDDLKLPRLVFVNKLDRAGSDTSAVIRDLGSRGGRAYFPVVSWEGEGYESVKVKSLDGEEFDEKLLEALAEVNDEAAEAFLGDEKIPHERLYDIMKAEISACGLVPVLCGSAKLGLGVRELCGFMTEYMPSSDRRATDELCGIIFKIEHDKQMGKVSYVRLFGGKITNRDEIKLLHPIDEKRKNPDGEEDDAVQLEEKPPISEKVTQIKKIKGGKYTDAGEVEAGDIAALCGLPSAKTGQFVGSLDISENISSSRRF